MKTKKSDLNLNAIGRAIMVIAMILIVVLLTAGIIDTVSDKDEDLEKQMRRQTKVVTTVHYIQNFPDTYKSVTYTIVYGDTLVRIAERNKPEYMTVSDYVDYLMYENNLKDSRIYEGQKITIMTEAE